MSLCAAVIKTPGTARAVGGTGPIRNDTNGIPVDFVRCGRVPVRWFAQSCAVSPRFALSRLPLCGIPGNEYYNTTIVPWMTITTTPTTTLPPQETTAWSGPSFRTDRASLVTVRPGRTLFVRKVRLGRADTDQHHHRADGENADAILQLVLVHGLCATERQFAPLLQALHVQLLKEEEEQQQQQQRPMNDNNNNNTNNKQKISTIDCLLYDWMGCGQSRPILREWDAYDNREGQEDLAALLRNPDLVSPSRPLILLGHSYAPSLMFPLLRERPQPNLVACILLGTAVQTPSLHQPNGGPWIMRSLPLVLLRCLQPWLSRAFVARAIHPDSPALLRHEIIAGSDTNDMALAQAYHGHTQWASPEDAVRAVGHVPCLILHGVDDGIITIAAGQELANVLLQSSTTSRSKLVAVERTSHLLMLEDPQRVAHEIRSFLSTL